MKILFATSEALPFIKTGGLADVCGSLPIYLKEKAMDVRLIIPGYRSVLNQEIEIINEFNLSIDFVQGNIRILETTLNNNNYSVPVYIVDAPLYFDRAGNPYRCVDGQDWQDNAHRFASFARIIASIALNNAGLHWQPDIVHCHDWQTGLVPALLYPEPRRPKTIFTIHNLAYQGLFSREIFDALELPVTLWHINGLEFYEKFSFIKGGIRYADYITTVSPHYAQEIKTEYFGCGLEGLLQAREDRLKGILNGIDTKVWNAATDTFIAKNYTADSFFDKKVNKQALQIKMGLEHNPNIPLLGHVGRLVSQKGIDLFLEIIDNLLESHTIQIVILGSGEKAYEKALSEISKRYPHKVAVHIGYDEKLAHLIEAGADMFFMPSRFEPCGLNQMYSLRYGTVPIVHGVGGLKDTVIPVNSHNIHSGQGTGFVFNQANAQALLASILEALDYYKSDQWHQICLNGMQQDFSWQCASQDYVHLYQQLWELRS